MTERRADNMERHVVTIICSLTAIGVVWIGSSIMDLKIAMAGLSEKFALRSELNSVKSDVKGLQSDVERLVSRDGK